MEVLEILGAGIDERVVGTFVIVVVVGLEFGAREVAIEVDVGGEDEVEELLLLLLLSPPSSPPLSPLSPLSPPSSPPSPPSPPSTSGISASPSFSFSFFF